MRIGDLARRSGVPAKTLRYYEERRILRPARRTPAGYREYDDSALAVLRFVRRAKRFGFTLAEIRDVLDAGGARCRAVRGLLDRKLDDLDRRIVELGTLRDELRRLRRRRTRSGGSWICPILEEESA